MCCNYKLNSLLLKTHLQIWYCSHYSQKANLARNYSSPETKSNCVLLQIKETQHPNHIKKNLVIIMTLVLLRIEFIP